MEGKDGRGCSARKDWQYQPLGIPFKDWRIAPWKWATSVSSGWDALRDHQLRLEMCPETGVQAFSPGFLTMSAHTAEGYRGLAHARR